MFLFSKIMSVGLVKRTRDKFFPEFIATSLMLHRSSFCDSRLQILQWRHRQDSTHLAALINDAASDNCSKRLLLISDMCTPAQEQA